MEEIYFENITEFTGNRNILIPSTIITPIQQILIHYQF